MNTQQKLLNDINRKIGYTGEDLSLQSASNWLAENVHLINGDAGGGGGTVTKEAPHSYFYWSCLKPDSKTMFGTTFISPKPTVEQNICLKKKNFDYTWDAIIYTGELEGWFTLEFYCNADWTRYSTTDQEQLGLFIKHNHNGKLTSLHDYTFQKNKSDFAEGHNDKVTANVFLSKGDRITIAFKLSSDSTHRIICNNATINLYANDDIELATVEGNTRTKSVAQPKAPYVGDFMTTQTALNYIAENIGTGGGGTGGAVTADDILRLMNNLGNVKMTKSGNQLQLQCDDNPTGDGIYGKTKEGRWEHIPSGAGGSIADFRLDENDPFGVKIVFDDGSHKSVNLLGMHREFPKGHAFQFEDVLRYDFDKALWSHVPVLNKDYVIPLNVFRTKKYKGGLSFRVEGDKHIIHFPEGNLTVKSKLDTSAVWKHWPEVSIEPYNTGLYRRTMKAFLRRQGSTTWELAGSQTYDWNETYGSSMPCGVNLRGVEVTFTLPDVPCDVYFTYRFDLFGNNPWEFLSMPLYFGADKFEREPSEVPAGTGFFISTTKVISDDWIPL